MRELGGNRSLRRRLGLGMGLVLGAGLAFAGVQSTLVDAEPATVSAADDAEFGQTRVANESTRASTQPLRSASTSPSAVACGYPDDCGDSGDNGGNGGVVTDDAPPALPASQDCTGSNPAPLDAPPYLTVDDDCDEARTALKAAGCSVTETVGIGDETYASDSALLPDALANRGAQNTSRYQLYTCAGGAEITLTTEIPPM